MRSSDPIVKARAEKELQGVPDCPEEVEYLVDWARHLVGRSGFRPDGAAMPLSHSLIADWDRLLDLRVQPYEVEALTLMDVVLRDPDAGKDEDDDRPRGGIIKKPAP